MKHKITRFFQNEVTGWLLLPVIIALPFALIICVLMPDINNKYRVDFIRNTLIGPDSRLDYHVMDNDGWSDHYYTGYYNGLAFITLFSNNQVIDQRNFEGRYFDQGKWSLADDYNGDGKKEIFLFICRNDSLFIHGLTFPAMKVFTGGGRFVTLLPGFANQGYNLHTALLADLNKDGFKELMLGISAGYEIHPRKVYAWDIVNDTIKETAELGTGITAMHLFYQNGDPYFAFTQYASMNYPENYDGMNDHSVYFMIIDKNLQFKFRPVEYKGVHQSYKMIPVKDGDSTCIIVYQGGDTLSKSTTVRVHNTNGRILYVRDYPRKDAEVFDIITAKTGDDGFSVIVQNSNSLEILNKKLELVSKTRIKTLGVPEITHIDADSDGRDELLFYSNKQGEYLLCRDDLTHPVKFRIDEKGRLQDAYVRLRGDNPPYLMLHVDDVVSTLQYRKNPWYILRYPVWAGVYLVILGFIFLIRRMQRIQLRRRYAMRQKMTELKLLSIRNQMDPHFTFNVLNAIGSVILQNKPEESYSMLMKYSKLLRSTYSASDKIYRTLAEELIFVTNYLELQKMRYHDHLKYRLELDEDVDKEIIVPKMVLQTYTENAIKHGIMRKTGGGSIDIRLFMENENLVITVKDDGIGRKRAAELRTSDSGQGLNIMHDCYSMVNRLNDKPITEEFTDLYDDNGEPAGTLVTIKIPVNLSVSIS